MTAQVTGGKVCPDGQSLRHTVFQRSQRGVVNSNLLEWCSDSTGWRQTQLQHFSFLCLLPCFRDFFARLTVFLILQGAIRRGRRPHFPPLFPLLRSLFDLTLQMPLVFLVSAVPRASRDRFLDVSASRGNRRPCRPSQLTKRDIFFLTGQSNPLHRLQLFLRQFWTKNGYIVESQGSCHCQHSRAAMPPVQTAPFPSWQHSPTRFIVCSSILVNSGQGTVELLKSKLLSIVSQGCSDSRQIQTETSVTLSTTLLFLAQNWRGQLLDGLGNARDQEALSAKATDRTAAPLAAQSNPFIVCGCTLHQFWARNSNVVESVTLVSVGIVQESLHLPDWLHFFGDEWVSAMWHEYANDNDRKGATTLNTEMAAHGLTFIQRTPWRKSLGVDENARTAAYGSHEWPYGWHVPFTCMVTYWRCCLLSLLWS